MLILQNNAASVKLQLERLLNILPNLTSSSEDVYSMVYSCIKLLCLSRKKAWLPVKLFHIMENKV